MQASALVKLHGSDAGALYRAARAAYNLSQQCKGDKAQEARLLSEALMLVREARRLDSGDSNVLRWSGIILQQWSEGQSTAEYIKSAFTVKSEWLAAVAANRNDARSWHLLGRWSAAVAAMPYWKRSLAATLFATPPRSTTAEAREYFMVAEAISSGDWVDNRVWLAQCSRSLGKPKDAAKWALAALALPARSEGDAKAHADALAILKAVDPAKAAEFKA
jgi:regulator of microtubule dynamics protein 3